MADKVSNTVKTFKDLKCIVTNSVLNVTYKKSFRTKENHLTTDITTILYKPASKWRPIKSPTLARSSKVTVNPKFEI